MQQGRPSLHAVIHRRTQDWRVQHPTPEPTPSLLSASPCPASPSPWHAIAGAPCRNRSGRWKDMLRNLMTDIYDGCDRRSRSTLPA